ncbi:MAG: 2-C-methyl-D-erythritol 4-phosphate cytidylyltransferase [Thermodesulfobacteriota bacterium]|nr:2-C-methyl-D-erythritol 4-phosphate cytidylyltransferase [Thermodesulfobacteriota bacterium]MEE2975793.1 2-C-methyl-D-erythritol 4-phosphate cytidylyltransferase [Thermodesulfobacteriota bacterium]
MSKKKLSFILTSAGNGTRFGKTNKGKQFELINDFPVMIYSLKSILRIKNVDQIIITINKKVGTPYIEKLLKKYSIKKKITVCYGGTTRARSVFNAFQKINADTGMVIIHDSARPNIDTRIVNKMIKSMGKYQGIILASKIQDTVKKASGKNLINKTVERDKLWCAETPQIFTYSSLKKCYESDLKFTEYTDEAQLLEKNGYKVKLYENNKFNLKITTKEDLNMYKLLLRNV